MKRLKKILFIAALFLILLFSAVNAQWANEKEALEIANNWTKIVIQKYGHWGGADIAFIDEIQEFKRGNRTIGYFCSVKPKGYIIISLRKELAPIKAYSATCNFDPLSEEGLADLIKDKMEGILLAIEQKVGSINLAKTEEVKTILEIDYSQSWDDVKNKTNVFKIKTKQIEKMNNYEEGDSLIHTLWHQGAPYNDQCEWMDCDYNNGKEVVGCVATAGAQIMKHWNWPPWGKGPYNKSYDWANMPNSIDNNSNQIQIDAVAILCHEVGMSVGMDYGCEGSFASTANMEESYRDFFRYSPMCKKRDRDDFTSIGWFNEMKAQFNANRPVQFQTEKHSLVGDGWQIFGALRQYHLNYGWGGSNNAWYTLDALSEPKVENMLLNIYPAKGLGPNLIGVYNVQSFPYRYFDQDATGITATFGHGQYLQFLPGITLKGLGYIEFIGSVLGKTWLFTTAWNSDSRIRIDRGKVKLYQNGCLKLY